MLNPELFQQGGLLPVPLYGIPQLDGVISQANSIQGNVLDMYGPNAANVAGPLAALMLGQQRFIGRQARSSDPGDEIQGSFGDFSTFQQGGVPDLSGITISSPKVGNALKKTILTKLYNREQRQLRPDDFLGIQDTRDNLEKDLQKAQNKMTPTITLQTKQQGGIPVSPAGLHAFPNQPVVVPSDNISMAGVNQPVLGIGDNGVVQMMQPEGNYTFAGANSVFEVPVGNFQLGGLISAGNAMQNIGGAIGGGGNFLSGLGSFLGNGGSGLLGGILGATVGTGEAGKGALRRRDRRLERLLERQDKRREKGKTDTKAFARTQRRIDDILSGGFGQSGFGAGLRQGVGGIADGLGAIAPFLNFIPVVGQAASLGAGAFGTAFGGLNDPRSSQEAMRFGQQSLMNAGADPNQALAAMYAQNSGQGPLGQLPFGQSFNDPFSAGQFSVPGFGGGLSIPGVAGGILNATGGLGSNGLGNMLGGLLGGSGMGAGNLGSVLSSVLGFQAGGVPLNAISRRATYPSFGNGLNAFDRGRPSDSGGAMSLLENHMQGFGDPTRGINGVLGSSVRDPLGFSSFGTGVGYNPYERIAHMQQGGGTESPLPDTITSMLATSGVDGAIAPLLASLIGNQVNVVIKDETSRKSTSPQKKASSPKKAKKKNEKCIDGNFRPRKRPSGPPNYPRAMQQGGFAGGLTELQAEVGEKISLPDGSIFKSNADKLHKHEDKETVTDILPSGSSYIFSDFGGLTFTRDQLKDIDIGIKLLPYNELKIGDKPEYWTLEKVMPNGRQRATPSDIVEVIQNKYNIIEDRPYPKKGTYTGSENDIFTQQTNAMNLESRKPYLDGLIFLSELNRKDNKGEVRSFKHGGKVQEYQGGGVGLQLGNLPTIDRGIGLNYLPNINRGIGIGSYSPAFFQPSAGNFGQQAGAIASAGNAILNAVRNRQQQQAVNPQLSVQDRLRQVRGAAGQGALFGAALGIPAFAYNQANAARLFDRSNALVETNFNLNNDTLRNSVDARLELLNNSLDERRGLANQSALFESLKGIGGALSSLAGRREAIDFNEVESLARQQIDQVPAYLQESLRNDALATSLSAVRAGLDPNQARMMLAQNQASINDNLRNVALQNVNLRNNYLGNLQNIAAQRAANQADTNNFNAGLAAQAGNQLFQGLRSPFADLSRLSQEGLAGQSALNSELASGQIGLRNNFTNNQLQFLRDRAVSNANNVNALQNSIFSGANLGLNTYQLANAFTDNQGMGTGNGNLGSVLQFLFGQGRN